MDLPYVMLKAAVSLDGYLDDCSPRRLVLSSAEDLARVDELRSSFDAILVGSETIRKDNPSLTVKNPRWIEKRESLGLSRQPIRITLSASGQLSKDFLFFSDPEVQKLVYCPKSTVPQLQVDLASVGTVIAIDAPEEEFVETLLKDLASRNIKRLLVEGGAHIHRLFLESNRVDELRVAVSPIFVADPNAAKFVSSGIPLLKRMLLIQVELLGDTVVVHYRPSRDTLS